jgi:hydrogenase maturation protease
VKVFFLGVGNLHRADDGVGPFLAEKLSDDPAFANAGIDVVPHSGEGASLMHIWEGADKVVIVDAMKSGGKLGEVRRFDAISEPLNYGVFRYSSHLFGLAEAVEMSRELGMMPKEMVIYGIEGIEFTFGAERSAEVEAALPVVEAAVRKEFGL